jgi:hypothetical protein
VGSAPANQRHDWVSGPERQGGEGRWRSDIGVKEFLAGEGTGGKKTIQL